MGKTKKLGRIVNAVTGILGREVEHRKLKKRRALKRFIERMTVRREEIAKELAGKGNGSRRRKLLREHLETLDKQIRKAQALLDQGDD